ncbi:VPS10 domain-containing protein [Salinivirga cyanobacteriivorans]
MKRISLLLTGLFMAVFLSAQPWTQNLPADKSSGELTLFDYQKAFEAYWEAYDLKDGYIINSNGEKQKAPGWKQFKRWEWYWETRVDPETGAFPDVNPMNIYKNWAAKNTTNGNFNDNWQSMGPNSSAGGYAGVGRINTIAFHPTDNDQYWIAAPSGGLWYTNNNGTSWTCLTDDNPVLGISDVLVPDDYETSNTIYIATGDRDGWDNNSVGVLKSTDGGSTWNSTGLSFNIADGEMVSRLLQDPNDTQTIIASTTNGVFKTNDGGDTWDQLYAYAYFIDMEYKPGNFSTLYGAKQNGQIMASTDGGESWSIILSLSASRTEIAVSPANPDVIYAIAANGSGGLSSIQKSTDSGNTFTELVDGSANGKNYLGWDNGYDDGGQGWYDLAIAVSPLDADIALIGGINTWRTTDGGQTWNMVNHWTGSYSAQPVHADKHMLKYRDNGDLFECNDGGVYISSTDGSNGSYNDKTNGMTISQIYRLGVSQTNSDEVIIGLQDNGTKLTYDNYWDDVRGGDGMECIIDYTDENIQYNTVYYGSIRRTTNHWSWSTDITPSGAQQGAWVAPYVMDQNDHNTLYAGYANVWKTTNQGNSWTQISTMNTSNKLRSLAVAPSNSDYIYTGDLYNIWRTTDGGSTWDNISQGISNAVTYIAVKHDDPNTLWVTVGGYNSAKVYESTNGGDTWTDISAGLPSIPATSIVENKLMDNPRILYLSTELGIYIKKGNEDWVPFNRNLPNVHVEELEIYYDETTPENSMLRAASYGRGLWENPITLNNNITFHIVSPDDEDVANALINLEGADPLMTNIGGLASAELLSGYYPVTITAAGYETFNDTVLIHGSNIVELEMTRGNYNVDFNVSNSSNGNNIENAEISISEGTTLTTNNSGNASVTLTSGDYTYSVNAVGYDPITNESFSVMNASQINITMNAVGLTNMDDKDFDIYPNPASDNLFIDVDGIYNVKLYTESGKILKELEVNNQGMIDIKEIASGVYFIELKNGDRKAIQKIIIE